MKKIIWIMASTLAPLMALLPGCGYEPDVSAPERPEIDRSADWTGALVHIADSEGPVTGWGSVRIYDNVSGLVERTLEQTAAASPVDVFVTEDDAFMFVAGGNGIIDRFSWDGNNWIPGGMTIETSATSLGALKPGPDGLLYAPDGAPAAEARLLVIDPRTGGELDPVSVPGLMLITGIAWSADGTAAMVVGLDEGSSPALVRLAWPSRQTLLKEPLTLGAVHQVEAAPDGLFAYVMGGGRILKVEQSSGKAVGSLEPEAAAEYEDSAFSTDGRFMFVTGNQAGADGTLFVVDLTTGTTVKSVRHISVKAKGIQRIE